MDFEKRIIKLNPLVLDTQAKLEETLLHEMLHIYCWFVYNCPGHNGMWKKIAKFWGMERCGHSKVLIPRRKKQLKLVDLKEFTNDLKLIRAISITS